VTATGTPVTLRHGSAIEIVDAAIPLARRAYVPAFLVWWCYQALYLIAYRAVALDARGGVRLDWTASIITYVADWVLLIFPTAIMFVLMSDVYLGRPARVGAAAARMVRRIIPLLVVHVVRTLVTVAGLAALIVPGIIYFMRSGMAGLVVMLDDREHDAWSALRRSSQLTRGEVRRMLALVGSTALIGMAIEYGAALNYTFLVGHHLMHPQVALALYTVLTSLIGPFASAVGVVFYYDLRIRREGFDIDVLSRHLTTSATASTM
jgi:hypothetical protein